MVDMDNQNIFCYGTVRAHRRNLPNFKCDKSLARSQSDWFSKKDMLVCVKCKHKRVVTSLSTVHSTTANIFVNKKKDGSTPEQKKRVGDAVVP